MALSNKQKAFIEEYLHDFNATQAAIRAGYSEKTAYNIGWENVRKREIAEAISRRLQEKAMSADEVLLRLADQARGTMEDFVFLRDDGEFVVDLAKAQDAGKLHLVKELTETKRVDKDGIIEIKTAIKLYDSHAALVDLGRHHKLFTDQVEHSGTVKSEIEHSVDSDSAANIFDILASVGAIPTDANDAKDDQLHTPSANG